MKIRFFLTNFLMTLFLLGVEIFIATKCKNNVFIRSYLGDVIAPMVLYFLILSFFNLRKKTMLLISIFIFSVIIEGLQYYKTADFLGFEKGSLPYIMLGNSFSWWDILCYAAGCLVVFVFNKLKNLF